MQFISQIKSMKAYHFSYYLAAVFMALIWGTSGAFAQNQTVLDPGFGDGGVVFIKNGGQYEDALATAVQPWDGKILVAGNWGVKHGCYLLRYLPDGTLDPDFGEGGLVFPDAKWDYPQCRDVLVQPDGKIVLVGRSGAVSGVFESFAVWRFLASGLPDPDFGTQGYVLLAYPKALTPQSIFQLPGGQYVIAGGFKKGPGVVLAGLTATGQLDSTFGAQHGFAVVDSLAGLTDGAAATDAVGNIYLAGNNAGTQAMVLKYKPNGVPDSTFGVAGLAVTSLATAANAVLVQADGRILLAGYAETAGDRDMAVVRLLPDGAPDPAFGAGGGLRRNFGEKTDNALALVIVPGQGIVVGGYSGNFRLMWKLKPDGTADPSFGTNGGIKQRLYPDSKERIYDLALDNQGNILSVGFFIQAFITSLSDVYFDDEDYQYNNKYDYNADILLLRYLPNGSPDVSFGCNGHVVKQVIDVVNTPAAACVQEEGKILVFGEMPREVHNPVGRPISSVLFRLMPDGAPDINFGQCGQTAFEQMPLDIIFHYAKQLVDARALVAQNGKIVAPGNLTSNKIRVFQLNDDGNMDHDFGSYGFALAPYYSGSSNFCYATAFQADNKVVAAGYYDPPNSDIAIARFTVAGQLDPSFGVNGVAHLLTSVSINEIPMGLHIQPDGRILVTGQVIIGNLVSLLAVRLMPNGSLDPDFGVGGKKIVSANGSIYFCASALLPDGKILIATDKAGIYRLNADGSIDKSFGINGLSAVFPGALQRLSSIAVDANGYIWACGGDDTPGFALMRLSPGGELDSGFGDNGFLETEIRPGVADEARFIRFQADGKLLVIGQSGGKGINNQIVVARFTGNSTGTHQAWAPSGLNISVQPNPAPASPTVVLDLSEEAAVQLEVLDMTGRPVLFMPAQKYAAGVTPVAFQARPLPAGMYVVRAQSGTALASLPFVVGE